MSCFQASREPLSRHFEGPFFSGYFSIPLRRSDECLADESTHIMLMTRELCLAQRVMYVHGQKS